MLFVLFVRQCSLPKDRPRQETRRLPTSSLGVCLPTFPATEKLKAQEGVEVEEESESLPSWVGGPLEMQGGQDHNGRCQSRDGRQPHGHRGDREPWPQKTKKHVVRQRQRALPSCQACPLSSHPIGGFTRNEVDHKTQTQPPQRQIVVTSLKNLCNVIMESKAFFI